MDISLLYKKLSGPLSADEEQELQQWLMQDAEHRNYYNRFMCQHQADMQDVQIPADTYREQFRQRLQKQHAKSGFAARRIYRRLAWSAAAVLAIAACTWMWKVRSASAPVGGSTDIYQACTAAMKAAKQSNGDVRCLEVGDSIFVKVGRGAEYRLTLEDGTQVWLNAESQVHLPLHFTGSERRVTLSGEAFFDVAKDPRKPFIVQSGSTLVEVHGTQFNVNARDVRNVRTTLVEGSVSLRFEGQQQDTRLTPGLTATACTDRQEIHVEAQPTEQYTGWKDGTYDFEQRTLREIFAEVACWYDISIELDADSLADECFTGSFPRTMPLADLLKTLQMGANVSMAWDMNGTLHVKPEAELRIKS